MIENWPSILPPLVAIVLAIKTRQIIISLASGIILGYFLIVLDKPDVGVIFSAFKGQHFAPVLKQIVAFFDGIVTSIKGCVDVFKSSGNTANIIFTALIGSMIALMQKSGGTKGFVDYFTKKNIIKSDRRLHLYTLFLGALIFIENNISSLVTGAVVRPFYEKRKISRTKLAYILDSTAAPICILIPLNAWWANIAQHLSNRGINWGFSGFLKAYSFNFYAIFAIILNLILIIMMKDFFTMKKYQNQHIDNAPSALTDEVLHIKEKAGVKPKAFNFLVPVISMIVILPLALWITGGGDMLGKTASGSTGVLWAVIGAIVIASIIYRIQKIMCVKEIMDTIIKGLGGFISISIILVLSFAIGNVCATLKTGGFFAKLIGNSRAAGALIPAGLFIISCIIAFATGTSWGTWAIMIPIAAGLVPTTGANIYMSIGAVLGGAIFGDHASPISDTTVISSAAAGCDVVEHVKTQLPYSLIAAGGAVVLYAILGFIIK